MTRYANTVVGSYPRPVQAADTMKKPTLTLAETDEMVRWAAKDQSDLGLDVITDGEAYRENMYYFYQKRVDGVTFENMPRISFGGAGFGIECPRVVGAIENPRFNLARNWKLARETAPSHVRVKQTVTGPHVLTRFSVNERKDLYPDEQALCRAWARVLRQELEQVIAAGCAEIQFDEPMWTEAPQQSEWAAEILNELIDPLPGNIRIGLHVCGGNPRRKRVYFTKYTDLAPAFRKAKIDEVLLEHCTLSYDLMDLWKLWDFQGHLGLGVIDQRSDDIETVDVIAQRIEPALGHFPRERLILTSECGFGHVPLVITRRKLAALVEASQKL
jgi:5-methyltetrahydropteroyltriglutamate--homocysteine methyltransferase